jgi:hypothetical protein
MNFSVVYREQIRHSISQRSRTEISELERWEWNLRRSAVTYEEHWVSFGVQNWAPIDIAYLITHKGLTAKKAPVRT